MSAAIGSLRRRVVLEVAADAPDGAGGVTRTWTALASLWATPAASGGSPGAPADSADRKAVNHRLRMRIRHRTPLPDATMRLVDGPRILAVVAAADPDGRGRWLDLTVEETAP